MALIKETYRLKPYTSDADIQKLEAKAAILKKRFNLSFRIIDMNFLSMRLRITARQEEIQNPFRANELRKVTSEFIYSVLPDVKVHVNPIPYRLQKLFFNPTLTRNINETIMDKPFEIEFWIGLEVIDYKEFDSMPHVPVVGEKIFLITDNENYNSIHGEYFKVTKMVSMFFGKKPAKQKICVWLEEISKKEFEAFI